MTGTALRQEIEDAACDADKLTRIIHTLHRALVDLQHQGDDARAAVSRLTQELEATRSRLAAASQPAPKQPRPIKIIDNDWLNESGDVTEPLDQITSKSYSLAAAIASIRVMIQSLEELKDAAIDATTAEDIIAFYVKNVMAGDVELMFELQIRKLDYGSIEALSLVQRRERYIQRRYHSLFWSAESPVAHKMTKALFKTPLPITLVAGVTEHGN